MTPADIDILQNLDPRMKTAITQTPAPQTVLGRAVAYLCVALAITGQWVRQARGRC